MASRKTGAFPHPGPAVPIEGETGPAWRLPSGQDLVSFALATGFAAQPLVGESAQLREVLGSGERAPVARKEVLDRPEATHGGRREG
jgi:hypothetical protein